MKKFSALYMAQAGVIAALYAVVTLALAPVAYGPFQFRISEVLTILPVFTPAAIPGLTIGCMISNGIGIALGTNIAGPLDILFGSLATLMAGILTRMLAKIQWRDIPLLSLFPPVLFNGLIIGGELALFVPELKGAFWLCAGQVALGEAVVCFGLGIPFILALNKLNEKGHIFRIK